MHLSLPNDYSIIIRSHGVYRMRRYYASLFLEARDSNYVSASSSPCQVFSNMFKQS